MEAPKKQKAVLEIKEKKPATETAQPKKGAKAAKKDKTVKPVAKAPEPVKAEIFSDKEEVHSIKGPDYGDESSDDQIQIEDVVKSSKMLYQSKQQKPKKEEIIESNPYQQAKYQASKNAAEEDKMQLEKGMKVKRVLGKKKTIKDSLGEWEVVDKRESTLVQKPVVTDSEDGSELSYD